MTNHFRLWILISIFNFIVFWQFSKRFNFAIFKYRFRATLNLKDQKSILFDNEKLVFMFSINFQFFEKKWFLSFLIIFGVGYPCFPHFYFLRISYSRPEIKSFYDFPRGKIPDFENESWEVFKKTLFFEKKTKRLWPRKPPTSSNCPRITL